MMAVDSFDLLETLQNHYSSLNVVDLEFESGHTLEVYVAVNQQQHKIGLSNVEEIDLNGMLFAFDVETYRPFTMKETKFDLDIGWYDPSGKLLKHETHKAGEAAPITSANPFKFVVEAPAGQLPLSDLKFNG